MSIPKAGALVRASDWSTVFPVDTDAWTNYTPTLVQSGAVTKTVNLARYTKVGRWVRVELNLACTGAGTANNEVQVGLPLTAAGGYAGFTALGAAGLFDSSVNTFYAGNVIYAGTTAVRMSISGSTAYAGLTGGVFIAALASGDQITMGIDYQTAA